MSGQPELTISPFKFAIGAVAGLLSRPTRHNLSIVVMVATAPEQGEPSHEAAIELLEGALALVRAEMVDRAGGAQVLAFPRKPIGGQS